MKVLLLFLFLFSLHFSEGFDEFTIITPDQEVNNEMLEYGSYQIYKIEMLSPEKYYEVRISYPSSTPAKFELQIFSNGNVGNERKLFDIEKIMFQTDQSRFIIGYEHFLDDIFLKVALINPGVTISPHAKNHVNYNIVLETLYFNIPFPVFRIIAFVIVIFLFLLLFIPRFVKFFTFQNPNLKLK